ncbi:MerR family transcriptional regulator [Streptomyces sp. NPDC003952]
MRIGELAKATGVSPRALRYYEDHGLIVAERSPSGQRRYTQDAVDRVRWIQALYGAGLNSKTILELFPGVPARVTSDSVVERLVAERERIDSLVCELVTTRGRLDTLIATASDPHEGCRPPVAPTD